MERNKKIIIASGIVSVMVLFMGIAFAALASSLNISFGNVTQNNLSWNVGFKSGNVNSIQKGTSSSGLSCGSVSVARTSVTIVESNISKPGDKCTYPLTIENSGDISAQLASIVVTKPDDTTCTIDGASMVCGNVTYKLETATGELLTTGMKVNKGEEYDIDLVVYYSSSEVHSEKIVQSNAKFTLTFNQSNERTDSESSVGIGSNTTKVCRRAKRLHTGECTMTAEDLDSDYNCAHDGYYEGGSQGTTKVTFGSYGTKGTLTAGDAFTCDVNGDGEYNEETERFYYLSGVDGTSTTTAALIYYNNVLGGIPTRLGNIAYNNTTDINYEGPIDAYKELPSTTQWSNVSLSNATRQIYGVDGTTQIYDTWTSTYRDLPVFTYTNKASRLPSYKEINAACNFNIAESGDNYTTNCKYLAENSDYYLGWPDEWNDSVSAGYWLENPYTYDKFEIAFISSGYVGRMTAMSNYHSVRPVIEVPLTDIDY